MTIRSIVLIVLSTTLVACGVRDEDLSGGSLAAGEPGTEAANINLGGGTVEGTEGDGPVALSFDGSVWTGFWKEQGSTDIARISVGEMYYHVELFTDESVRQGAAGRNCFEPAGNFWLTPSGQALRRPHQLDLEADYEEWTLNGTVLLSSFYDPAGELDEGLSESYERTFTGLAISDLQVCNQA